MPRRRVRQKLVYCDCFDCKERLEPSVTSEASLEAAAAAARQQPPPKALIIYASRVLRGSGNVMNVDDVSVPHLHKTVREGSLGMLAVRQNKVEGIDSAVMELAQLLGVHKKLEVLNSLSQFCESRAPYIHSFQGLQSSFASTSSAARHLASAVGMELQPELQLNLKSPSPQCSKAEEALLLPPADVYAKQLLDVLDIDSGSDGLDLLMLHVDVNDLLGSSKESGSKLGGAACGMAHVGGVGGEMATQGGAGDEMADRISAHVLEWLDTLVGCLLAVQGVKERTLLTVMLGSQGVAMQATQLSEENMMLGGTVLDPDALIITPRSLSQAARRQPGALGVLDADEAEAPAPHVARPLKSFQSQGGVSVDVQQSAPVLVARRLPGVVRRDRAERLGVEEYHLRGGMGCILAEQLLPEIAFKLG